MTGGVTRCPECGAVGLPHASAPDSEIATYIEVQIGASRTFHLTPGRLTIVGTHGFANQYRQVIDLASLGPTYDWGRAWSRQFWGGIAVSAGCFLVLAVYLGFDLTHLTLVKGLLIAGIPCAALYASAFRHRLEWVSFRTQAGVPALSVIRVGKGAAEFDSFIQALVREIGRVSATTEATV